MTTRSSKTPPRKAKLGAPPGSNIKDPELLLPPGVPWGSEDDRSSSINGEVSAQGNRTTSSLDLISESLQRDIKYGDPKSYKLAEIVKTYYFEVKCKVRLNFHLAKQS